ncbi:sigma factor [Paenibacillus macerans]|uniref:sigma factor n=1 Tax=Paenibacillus macerans TaxID=44252 RepID=UPI002DBB7D6E|nr:sigma factor [Paenibacillus macerans]MEC0328743.1 sigma factor [Paenibacillus macerans]
MEFNEKFKKYYPLIRSISFSYHKSTGIPAESFESELCESLWKALRTFDERKEAKLDTWVTKVLRHAAIDVIRSAEGGYYRRVYAIIDAPDDEDAPTSEVPDEETTEDGYFRRRYKKKADQRQLIDFLLHSGNPDATTIAVVEAYLAAPPSASDTAIAESIGIHHMSAKRSLRKLSRYYDANRFGDISDYLAV